MNMSFNRFKFILLFLVMGLAICFAINVASAQSWTLVNTLTNVEQNYTNNEFLSAVASSADGNKLVATVLYGGFDPFHPNYPYSYFYTSTNAGATWVPRFPDMTTLGWFQWGCVASSADGTKLVAPPYWTHCILKTLSLFQPIQGLIGRKLSCRVIFGSPSLLPPMEILWRQLEV